MMKIITTICLVLVPIALGVLRSSFSVVPTAALGLLAPGHGVLPSSHGIFTSALAFQGSLPRPVTSSLVLTLALAFLPAAHATNQAPHPSARRAGLDTYLAARRQHLDQRHRLDLATIEAAQADLQHVMGGMPDALGLYYSFLLGMRSTNETELEEERMIRTQYGLDTYLEVRRQRLDRHHQRDLAIIEASRGGLQHAINWIQEQEQASIRMREILDQASIGIRQIFDQATIRHQAIQGNVQRYFSFLHELIDDMRRTDEMELEEEETILRILRAQHGLAPTRFPAAASIPTSTAAEDGAAAPPVPEMDDDDEDDHQSADATPAANPRLESAQASTAQDAIDDDGHDTVHDSNYGSDNTGHDNYCEREASTTANDDGGQVPPENDDDGHVPPGDMFRHWGELSAGMIIWFLHDGNWNLMRVARVRRRTRNTSAGVYLVSTSLVEQDENSEEVLVNDLSQIRVMNDAE